MYARSTTLGILAAIALGLPRSFGAALHARHHRRGPPATPPGRGALRHRAPRRRRPLRAHRVPRRRPARAARSSSALPGDRLPRPAAIPSGPRWDDTGSDPAFHASFAAGSPEHPLGWFHGESGSVTITRGGRRTAVRLASRSRPAASSAPIPDDENRWVTVTRQLRGRRRHHRHDDRRGR